MTGPHRAVQVPGLLVAVLLLIAAVVGGCGVGGQQEPDTVTPPTAPPPAAARTPEPGSALVTVYFLRDQHLVEAERRGLRTAQASLDLLTVGPTPGEVAGGIDTAIAPQSITLDPRTRNSRTIDIAVGAEFATLTGRRQLLAVGQVVWTVTAVPGVEGVRFVLEGQPLATPTDDGLTWSEVDRSDYDLVAPVPRRDLVPGDPPG